MVTYHNIVREATASVACDQWCTGAKTRWDPGTDGNAGRANDEFEIRRFHTQAQHHDQRMTEVERQLREVTAGRGTGSGSAKNLTVEPPAMVGLGLCTAAIHDVSYNY